MKASILRLFAPVLALVVLTGCPKDIPVTDIEIDPSSATLFVGESIDLTVRCTPEDATNLDELMVYSSNESIAKYENGRVTGVDGGTTAITASCGNVMDQSRIKVYRYKLIKGGKAYGINFAKGYQSLYEEPNDYSYQFFLIHNASDGSTQNFQTWFRSADLGRDIDYTKEPSEIGISVFMNNNEDGYCLYWGDEGIAIRTADWSDVPGVTLTRGNLRIDHIQGHKYKVFADFALSNGYEFSVDWEGTVSMTM